METLRSPSAAPDQSSFSAQETPATEAIDPALQSKEVTVVGDGSSASSAAFSASAAPVHAVIPSGVVNLSSSAVISGAVHPSGPAVNPSGSDVLSTVSAVGSPSRAVASSSSTAPRPVFSLAGLSTLAAHDSDRGRQPSFLESAQPRRSTRALSSSARIGQPGSYFSSGLLPPTRPRATGASKVSVVNAPSQPSVSHLSDQPPHSSPLSPPSVGISAAATSSVVSAHSSPASVTGPIAVLTPPPATLSVATSPQASLQTSFVQQASSSAPRPFASPLSAHVAANTVFGTPPASPFHHSSFSAPQGHPGVVDHLTAVQQVFSALIPPQLQDLSHHIFVQQEQLQQLTDDVKRITLALADQAQTAAATRTSLLEVRTVSSSLQRLEEVIAVSTANAAHSATALAQRLEEHFAASLHQTNASVASLASSVSDQFSVLHQELDDLQTTFQERIDTVTAQHDARLADLAELADHVRVLDQRTDAFAASSASQASAIAAVDAKLSAFAQQQSAQHDLAIQSLRSELVELRQLVATRPSVSSSSPVHSSVSDAELIAVAERAEQALAAGVPAPPSAPAAPPAPPAVSQFSARSTVVTDAPFPSPTEQFSVRSPYFPCPFFSRSGDPNTHHLRIPPPVSPVDPASDDRRPHFKETFNKQFDVPGTPRLNVASMHHIRYFLMQWDDYSRSRADLVPGLDHFAASALSCLFVGEASLFGSKLPELLSGSTRVRVFPTFLRWNQLRFLLRSYVAYHAPTLEVSLRLVPPFVVDPYSSRTAASLRGLQRELETLAQYSRKDLDTGCITPDDSENCTKYLLRNICPSPMLRFVEERLKSVHLLDMLLFDHPDGTFGALSLLHALCLHDSSNRKPSVLSPHGTKQVDVLAIFAADPAAHRAAFGAEGTAPLHETVAPPPITALEIAERQCLPASTRPQLPHAAAPVPAAVAAHANPSAPPAAPQQPRFQSPVAPRRFTASVRVPTAQPPSVFSSRAEALSRGVCREHLFTGACTCSTASFTYPRLHGDQTALAEFEALRAHYPSACTNFLFAGVSPTGTVNYSACAGDHKCSGSHPSLPAEQPTVLDKFITRVLSRSSSSSAGVSGFGSGGPGAGGSSSGGDGAGGSGSPGPSPPPGPSGGAPGAGSKFPNPSAGRYSSSHGRSRAFAPALALATLLAASAVPLPPLQSAFPTPIHVATTADPYMPRLVPVVNHLNGTPSCSLECGPIQVVAIFDTAAQGDYHYVTGSLLASLSSQPSPVLEKMGFCVDTLDPPVERTVFGNLISFAQFAVIPTRFFAFALNPDASTLATIDLANESDKYLVLPPLPEGKAYPFDICICSPTPGSDPDPRGDRWGTRMRMNLETRSLYSPARIHPSQTSTEPLTVTHMLQKLGVIVRSPGDDTDSSGHLSDASLDTDTADDTISDRSFHVPATSSDPSLLVNDTISAPTFPSAPSSRVRSRGRSCHVHFSSATDVASRPEGSGARPLSAPPYPRDSSSHPDSSVDFSGYESDRGSVHAARASPVVAGTPSDAEILSHFDRDFITLGGTRPELMAEVWEITGDILRLACGPIPPTHELPVVVSIRIREGAELVCRKQPRFKPQVMAKVNAVLDSHVAKGFHEPVPPDVPHLVNNVVFGVPKPSNPNELRVVTDFKDINSVTINDSVCTLPKDILAIMQQFFGCECFTRFDCADSYYAMALDEQSRNLTIYTRPGTSDRYRNTRAIQGGRDMANHCHNVIHTAVTAPDTPNSTKDSYMDDGMIGSVSDKSAADPHRKLILDGAHALAAVMRSLVPTGQRLKLPKCLFLSRIGGMVGFETDGIRVWHEPSRLAPIRELKPPASLKEARRYLGLVASRSQFLAKALEPLLVLSRFARSDRWPASGLPSDVREACVLLRDTIADNTPLRLIDPSLPVHVRNDASALATGGVIGQYDQHTGEWYDIAFFYHQFNAIQQRYHTNLREFLGFAMNVLRYRHMLAGLRVIGWVDHQNLLYLTRSDNQRLLRIALSLVGAGIDFCLIYEPTFRFHLVDALSRAVQNSSISSMPIHSAAASDDAVVAPPMALATLVPPAVAPVAADPALDVAPPDVASDLHAVSFIPSVDIIAAIPYANVLGLPANVHPIVHSVIAAQQSLSSSDRATFLKRDHASELRLGTVSALYIAGRLFIPSSAKALHTAYVSAVHDIVCASALDMVERLRNSVKVFWDSMFADAEAYRKSCGRCQHVAAGHRPVSVGRMQQFLYSAPNDTLFVDIYGPLVDCRRRNPLDLTGSEHVYRYLFTLTDGYSRFTIFLPSTDKSASAAVAAYTHWTTFLGGPPRVVRTDADVVFSSSEFRTALQAAGSIHDPVPPYTHHQMGLLERAHSKLGDFLRVMGGYAVSEWVDFIPTITAWRNSCLNRSLGVSSYEAYFGRPATYAYERLGINDVIPVTPNELSNISAALDLCIRTSASVSTAVSAAQYDRNRLAPPVYKCGDTVLVHFEDRPSKSHPHYRGPFTVVSPADDSGNYYTCKDMIQFNEYDVHVERMKPFDMSRTSLQAQAQRQLPSRDLLIVTGVDGHRMNEKLGFYEFCICFYSGFRAWRLYPEVQNLDAVKKYVQEHKLNTRRKTPSQQYATLVSSSAAVPITVQTSRPLPSRRSKRSAPA
jgi:hypothetical protein